jgi:hypothetical protein
MGGRMLPYKGRKPSRRRFRDIQHTVSDVFCFSVFGPIKWSKPRAVVAAGVPEARREEGVIHTHRYAALLPLPLAMINDDAAATTAVPRIVIPTTDSVAFVFGSARSGSASSPRPSSSPAVPQRPRSTLTAAQLTRHSRGAMDLRAYVAAKKTPKGFVPLRDLKPRQCRCFARAPFALTDRSRSRLAVSRYAPT